MIPLSEDLRDALETALTSSSCKQLKGAREALTADYRAGQSSKRGFQNRTDFLAYLATRMPATFGACAAVAWPRIAPNRTKGAKITKYFLMIIMQPSVASYCWK